LASAFVLLVGLGNPGEKYERTRHNAGFWLLDVLANSLGATFRAERRYNAEIASATIGGQALHLLKPMTFMNRSGQAVAPWARYHQVAPDRMLVVHDEIDLPPGVARLKRGGGAGGHNGLRDIIAAFGNEQNFYRLRIGVGRPGPSADGVVDYVLKSPPSAERALITTAIDAALAVMPQIVAGEIERAMQHLHTKEPAPSGGS
jgi:PTH1 family peptidyl-tRNA hydrolase